MSENIDKKIPKMAAGTPAAAKTSTPAAPVKVPPMFRKMDWMTMGITFLVVWVAYLFTLAPEQTLKDSGELCTASYYAGIPHPPGYPFWSLYSWFWTFILPFGNVAWRVEVGQSFASAMGCGLLALMVSRGGSMLVEGIEELKSIDRRWENAICTVTGFVAGTLLGFSSYLWTESVVVNRISVFGVPWMTLVVLFLFRWMYAPQQRRYLYLAIFVYGLCATIHQSLLLSAMGVQILIALIHPRLGRDIFAGNSIIYLVTLLLMSGNNVPALEAMTQTQIIIFHIVGIGSLMAVSWLFMQTQKMFTEWKAIVVMAVMWVLGVSFYLYMPVACMTTPPMQWGYPRTVEGFFHALSRGQYGGGEGTNIISDPSRFIFQLWYIAKGLSESFSWVYMFIGLLPFLFIKKMHKRERSWIIGVSSIYFFLSVLLVILLNISPDRATTELNKVFFTASHAMFAMMIGYGMILLAAYVATHYQNFRRWGLIGASMAAVLAVYCLIEAIGSVFFGIAGQMRVSWLPAWCEWLAIGPDGQFGITEIPKWVAQAFAPDQYGLPIYSSLILFGMCIVFVVAMFVYRKRGPVLILLGLFLLMPFCSGLSHWYKCEQRNHWFGYWFGHDMFTPPFEDPKTGKLSYDNVLRAELLKDSKNARLVYPEMARNTILFGGTDPGRFCPTYSIFCDSFIPDRCKPEQDQKFDRRDVYLITQNALADGTYLCYLRSQYNRSAQIDPPFFSRLVRYVSAVVLGKSVQRSVVMDGQEKGQGDTRIGLIEGVCSLLDNTLDKWFRSMGERVAERRRKEGVFPANEIHIPTPEESQQCFAIYQADAAARAAKGQLRHGEDVKIITDANGVQRVSISGTVAVMMINGLLCKVIFDQCPTNEFYIEESFPLDWMYPYETPFGIIMKINRNPVMELSQDVLDLDHKFWSDYSTRLCGNWITYDTPIKEITDFVERVYIKNNYKGYKGDLKFVSDEDAKKAFSKLRSSIAGMYAWRWAPSCPPEYRQKTPAAQEALRRETDFAFKQAFAFCPYSPEAVFRYASFLMQNGRFDDAILIAETCKKMDPFNDQITGLIGQIKDYKKHSASFAQTMGQIDQMESLAKSDPNNVPNLLMLASAKIQMQQPERAAEHMVQALNSTKITAAETESIANYFQNNKDLPRLKIALEKLVSLTPTAPEPQYNLAGFYAFQNDTSNAMKSLTSAITLNNNRKNSNPGAYNTLLNHARTNPFLTPLQSLPEYKALFLQN